MNFHSNKTKKLITVIIAVIIIASMLLPMVISAIA